MGVPGKFLGIPGFRWGFGGFRGSSWEFPAVPGEFLSKYVLFTTIIVLSSG